MRPRLSLLQHPHDSWSWRSETPDKQRLGTRRGERGERGQILNECNRLISSTMIAVGNFESTQSPMGNRSLSLNLRNESASFVMNISHSI
jgi:hypothetical protein